MIVKFVWFVNKWGEGWVGRIRVLFELMIVIMDFIIEVEEVL